MKCSLVVSLAALLSLPVFADAVIMNSGERYIGELAEEGESWRIKNATFPDGLLVKKADVKSIYPAADVLLARLGKVVDEAHAKYEIGKKAADPTPIMKSAIDMLFDPELEAQEGAEVYPAEKEKFAAMTSRIHDLRKLCRDGQSMAGPPAVDPAKPPPAAGAKPTPAKPGPAKPDPAKPDTAKADPEKPVKPVPTGDAGEALEVIRSGGPGELRAALAKVNVPKEERLASPMLERLKIETDPQAREVLKEAIGSYAGFVVVRTIENGLKGKNVTDQFRCDCCDILVTKKEDKAVSIATDMAFASEKRETRDYCRGVLSATGNACLKPLNRYIHHPDARTRVSAVEFAASIGTPEAYGLLVGCLLHGSNSELMAQASIDVALRDLVCDKMIAGGDKACPALVAGLSGNTRKWCCFCLSKISGEGYAESDVKSWTNWWRKRAAESSGK